MTNINLDEVIKLLRDCDKPLEASPLMNDAALCLELLRNIRNVCDVNCKEFPHKVSENYDYWDIQDRIDTFFGKGEKL